MEEQTQEPIKHDDNNDEVKAAEGSPMVDLEEKENVEEKVEQE